MHHNSQILTLNCSYSFHEIAILLVQLFTLKQQCLSQQNKYTIDPAYLKLSNFCQSINTFGQEKSWSKKIFGKVFGHNKYLGGKNLKNI